MSLATAVKSGEFPRGGQAAGGYAPGVQVPMSLIMPVPESCAVVLYCPSCQQVFTRGGHQVGGMVCECGEHELLQVLEVRRYQDVLNPVIIAPKAADAVKESRPRKNRNTQEWADIIEKCVAGHQDGLIWSELKKELDIANGSLNKAIQLLIDEGRVKVKKIGNSNQYQCTGKSRGA